MFRFYFHALQHTGNAPSCQHQHSYPQLKKGQNLFATCTSKHPYLSVTKQSMHPNFFRDGATWCLYLSAIFRKEDHYLQNARSTSFEECARIHYLILASPFKRGKSGSAYWYWGGRSVSGTWLVLESHATAGILDFSLQTDRDPPPILNELFRIARWAVDQYVTAYRSSSCTRQPSVTFQQRQNHYWITEPGRNAHKWMNMSKSHRRVRAFQQCFLHTLKVVLRYLGNWLLHAFCYSFTQRQPWK